MHYDSHTFMRNDASLVPAPRPIQIRFFVNVNIECKQP